MQSPDSIPERGTKALGFLDVQSSHIGCFVVRFCVSFLLPGQQALMERGERAISITTLQFRRENWWNLLLMCLWVYPDRVGLLDMCM